MKKYFLFVCVFLLASVASAQVIRKNPFFLVGDGHLKIKNQHNGRFADVMYLNADGSLNEDAFLKIDQVFGFPTELMGENISRRTVAFLDYFVDQYNKDTVVQLASGYRSQDYNNALRRQGRTAAKTSTHIDGMAIDFSIPGVNGKELWEKMRAANCCGAGYYYGNIVHLDSGRPRFWTTETSKVNTGESDFNRYIYASTEYDRYQASDKVRVFFTSVSDFGFGVKPQVMVVKDEAGEDKTAEAVLSQDPSLASANSNSSCLKIENRKQARFLQVDLPKKLKVGTYHLRLDFCDKPFEQMPDFRVTNAIEIKKE